MANEPLDLGGGILHYAEKNSDESFRDFEHLGRTDEDLKISLNFDAKIVEVSKDEVGDDALQSDTD